jgi:SPP1 gp7 family putative phage head morphogenesis protein
VKFSDDQIKELIAGIYAGEIDEYNLPVELYLAIADYLEKAVVKGVKEVAIEFGGKPLELIAELRENIYMFSAAKTFQQVREMTDLLLNDEGVKGFSAFKKDALQIYDQYNVNWLQTEYNTAIGQAQSAERWRQIEDTADVLPMLTYSAIIDANTSDICAPLNGITLPVGDKFWNTHAPLNHFNCRCLLIQTEGKETPKSIVKKAKEEIDPQMQDMFKMNPGKDKVIFSKEHPYFDVAPKDKEFAKRNFYLPIKD